MIYVRALETSEPHWGVPVFNITSAHHFNDIANLLRTHPDLKGREIFWKESECGRWGYLVEHTVSKHRWPILVKTLKPSFKIVGYVIDDYHPSVKASGIPVLSKEDILQ